MEYFKIKVVGNNPTNEVYLHAKDINDFVFINDINDAGKIRALQEITSKINQGCFNKGGDCRNFEVIVTDLLSINEFVISNDHREQETRTFLRVIVELER